MALRQTCPIPGRGKSGDLRKKKSEDCSKNSEILFFPRSSTFSIKGTRHQPNSQGLLPLSKWRTDTEKTDSCDELLNTSKNRRSSVQKSSKNSVFSLLVYHFVTLAFLKNIPLLLFIIFRKIFFPKKTVRLGALS